MQIDQATIPFLPPSLFNCADTLRNRSFRAVEDTPQAVGLPTGWSVASGGFGTLDKDVKESILLTLIAFERMAMLCDTHRDKSMLLYSCDKSDETKIETGTF